MQRKLSESGVYKLNLLVKYAVRYFFATSGDQTSTGSQASALSRDAALLGQSHTSLGVTDEHAVMVE